MLPPGPSLTHQIKHVSKTQSQCQKTHTHTHTFHTFRFACMRVHGNHLRRASHHGSDCHPVRNTDSCWVFVMRVQRQTGMLVGIVLQVQRWEMHKQTSALKSSALKWSKLDLTQAVGGPINSQQVSLWMVNTYFWCFISLSLQVDASLLWIFHEKTDFHFNWFC